MRLRPRLDTLLLAVTAAVCAAFVVSFVLGLGSGSTRATPALDPVPPRTAGPAIGRVEVLNASGRSGMARHATARLREAGLDVVYYGNAPSSVADSSVVLVRAGGDVAALAAARAMGIESVRTERDTALFLDATVIIGSDWEPADAPSAAGRGWLRRLLHRLRPAPGT
jgi:hypothetical protein